MLKREITYKTLDDEEVTDVFYFHIGKPELITLEAEFEGGLNGMIRHIIESNNNKEILAFFKRFILMSHGKRSEDSKRFIKSDELRTEFEQSMAYEKLFTEMFEDPGAFAVFLKGALPKDLADNVDKAVADVAKDANKQLPQTT